MRDLIRRFINEECGQDLTEWALIVAFVSLGATGLLMESAHSFRPVWNNANLALQGPAVPGASVNSH